MKYFEHNFNVKIVYNEYSELDHSWGLTNTVDPFIRLYYIASGCGRVLCGKQNIFLEKGKFYLLPSQTQLTFWTTGYVNIHWAHVRLTLTPGIDIFNVVSGKVMCIPTLGEEIIGKFKVFSEGRFETLSDELKNQALVTEIIALFFQRYSIQLPKQFERDLRRFKPVIDLLEKNPEIKWTVSELARKTGLERVRFSTEFKRVFGMPPAKFIMRRRLEKVRYLLLNTPRTLDDIATDLGFCDAFHLSKTFKANVGFSPKEFRTLHKTVLP